MLNTSNKSSASANILKQFVPIFEQLEQLKTKYDTGDFGKQYNAIPSAMKSAFKDLGVGEFTVAVGETVDMDRMSVVESEYSETAPMNTVSRPLTLGLELKGGGNAVIRPANCVASLGAPPQVNEEIKESEETEAAKDA